MEPRNPDFQFVSTDTNLILSSLIAGYERITGISVGPSSPEGLFIRWVADIIVQERALNNFTGNQNLPSRAIGENLDSLAQLFRDQVRPDAQSALSTQRFHISAAQITSILVPSGVRVTDTGGVLVWETTVDAYIPIGATFVDVQIRCQTPGVVGNGFAIGQINTLIDVDRVLFYDRCENITVSDGGADRATDGEFYELLRLSMDTFSTAGSRGAYIYHAMRTSTEIADVVATSPMPGQANIYVLMGDGTIAGPELKNAVLEACTKEEVKPLTDLVIVDDPETVPYNIYFTYYISRRSQLSSSEIEADVAAAVQDYISWQHGRLGRDINPDELRRRVMAAGVKRLVLTEPVFTVLYNGIGETVPQVAEKKVVGFINGGYEDE
jgi:phage-related baseplate assembly protein